MSETRALLAQALELGGERLVQRLQGLDLGPRVRLVVEREVGEPEVVVRLGVVGLYLRGALEGRGGVAVLSEVAVGDAEVEEGVGVVGLELDGLVELGDGV